MFNYVSLRVVSNLPTRFYIPSFKKRPVQNLASSLTATATATATTTATATATSTASKLNMHQASIISILPRMKRLNGPFGIYGTVYFSQKVVHVADRTVAMALLGMSPSQSSPSFSSSSFSTTSPTPITGTAKNPAYAHFLSLFGRGTFTSEGSEWKKKRQSVIHSLCRGEMMSKLDEIVLSVWDGFASGIDNSNKINSNSNSNINNEINILPHLQRATIGVIYNYLTHNELNSTKNCSEATISNYLKSIITIRLTILANSREPYKWFFLKVPKFVQEFISPSLKITNSLENESLPHIKNFAREAVENAMPGSPIDEMKNKASHQENLDDVLDEAITLMFAGQDTSAATMGWILHLLSLNSKVQEKLREEVLLGIGDKGKGGGVVTKEGVMGLKYLGAVIKEGMRLYPVAPFVVRRVVGEDMVIEREDAEGGREKVRLTKGTLGVVWIHGLHRNDKYWARPDEFLPERWLEGGLEEEGKGKVDFGVKNAGCYMPFAGGPRGCIGREIANVVIRILLAKCMVEYEVVGKGALKEMEAGFTVLPTGGVNVLMLKR